MATCVVPIVPIVPIVPFLSCPLVVHRCQSRHQPEPLEAEPLEVQQGPHQGVRESRHQGVGGDNCPSFGAVFVLSVFGVLCSKTFQA